MNVVFCLLSLMELIQLDAFVILQIEGINSKETQKMFFRNFGVGDELVSPLVYLKPIIR